MPATDIEVWIPAMFVSQGKTVIAKNGQAPLAPARPRHQVDAPQGAQHTQDRKLDETEQVDGWLRNRGSEARSAGGPGSSDAMESSMLGVIATPVKGTRRVPASSDVTSRLHWSGASSTFVGGRAPRCSTPARTPVPPRHQRPNGF